MRAARTRAWLGVVRGKGVRIVAAVTAGVNVNVDRLQARRGVEERVPAPLSTI